MFTFLISLFLWQSSPMGTQDSADKMDLSDIVAFEQQEYYSYDSSHVGYLGTPSKNFAVYRSMSGDMQPKQLETLLTHEHPVTVAYALRAMRARNMPSFVDKAIPFISDTRPLETRNGCLVSRTFLGVVVFELLTKRTFKQVGEHLVSLPIHLTRAQKNAILTRVAAEGTPAVLREKARTAWHLYER